MQQEHILEVSFQDDGLGFPLGASPAAASNVAMSLADQTSSAIALPDDSLDDICDQIRMLRTAVLPTGTLSAQERRDWIAEPTPTFSALGEQKETLAAPLWEQASATPAAASTSLAPSQHNFAHGTLSTTSTSSYTAHTFGSPTRSSFGLGAAAVGHKQNREQFDPIREAMRMFSPIRVRNTLWEERQMERCFSRWRHWRDWHDSAAISELGSAHSGEGESRICPCGACLAPESRFCRHCGAWYNVQPLSVLESRLETCTLRPETYFRAWHRHFAARRADDLALSVRLLNQQVSTQLRRGLVRWWTWSQGNKGRKTVLKFQASMRRLSLRRWHSTSKNMKERRMLRDQVGTLLRAWLLRHSTRQWSRQTALMARWRHFQNRRSGSYLRWAFASWRSLRAYLQLRSDEAQAHGLVIKNLAKRSALRRWLRVSQESMLQRSMQTRSRQLALASALHTLAKQAKTARLLSRNRDITNHRYHRRAQAVTLLAWARWSYRRLQLRRIYRGYLATRVRPQVQRSSFNLWISVVRREQRHQSALHRAKIVMALSLKGRTFQSWMKIRLSTKKAVAVLKALGSTNMSWIFRCWVMGTQSLKHERKTTLTAEQHRYLRLVLMCFRGFCDGVSASKVETQWEALAERRLRQFATQRVFQQFRSGVAAERLDRRQYRHASDHHRGRFALRQFALWRAHAAAERVERQQHQFASVRRASFVTRASWERWHRYIKFRKHKRHVPRVLRVKEAAAKLRRRQHFLVWSRASSAAEHRRRFAEVMIAGIQRAFFGWGRVIREQRFKCQRVQELQLRHRTARVVHSMKTAHMAIVFCRTRAEPGLARDALRTWRSYLEESLRQRELISQDASTHRSQRLQAIALNAFQGQVLRQRELQMRLSALVGALQCVGRWHDCQAQAWALDIWQGCVEECHAAEAAEMERSFLEMQYVCFHYWQQYCQQQSHKRSVHVVCDQLRQSRLLGTSFRGWYTTCARIAEVADAVYYWAASLATQRALALLLIWRQTVEQRIRCRGAFNRVVVRRRRRTWSIWYQSLKRKHKVGTVIAKSMTSRLLMCILGWRERTSAGVLKRHRNQVMTEAVRRSRKRRWIDQWSEAGRWHRKGQIAVSWDDQVSCRRWVQLCFDKWAELPALYSKAQAAAARIGRLRARRHMRSWAELKHMNEVRARSLAELSMSAWRRAVAHGRLFRHAAQRLQERSIKAALRQLHVHRQESKQLGQRHDRFYTRIANRSRAEAISWWRKWSTGIQRKMRHGYSRGLELQDSLRRRQMKDLIGTWHTRSKNKSPLNDKFVEVISRRRHHYLSSWHHVWQEAPKRLQDHGGALPSQTSSSPGGSLPARPKFSEARVSVKIIGAQGLRHTDWYGRSDPYCVCEVQSDTITKTRFQTAVVLNERGPVWDEEHVIDRYSIGDSLNFTVMEKAMWPKGDECLGAARLPSSQFYPHGYRGQLQLDDAGNGVNATLQVSIQMLYSPQRHIHQLAPTVARALMPLTLGMLLSAWRTQCRKQLDLGVLEATVRSKNQEALRVRFFARWLETYDHGASIRVARHFLGGFKASRIVHNWAKFASFRKRFKAHVDHVWDMKCTQMTRFCFQSWHESLKEHYHIAAMWLDRWKLWSSSLIAAWRGFIRERRKLRRSMQRLRAGIVLMRGERRADLHRLVRLSALLRECFAAFNSWTKRATAVRGRCRKLEEVVAIERQRRRLCSWAAFSRGQFKEGVDSLRDVMYELPADAIIEHRQDAMMDAQLAPEKRIVHLQEAVFAFWAARVRGIRPVRQASRALFLSMSMRRSSQGLRTWRAWAHKRRNHNRAVSSHRAGRALTALRLCTVAWRQVAHSSLRAAEMHSAKGLHGMRQVWRAWLLQAHRSKKARRFASAFRNLHEAQTKREVLWSWSSRAGKDGKVRRMFKRLEDLHTRWISEGEWRARAAGDAALRAMFCRFAAAFDQQRAAQSTGSGSTLGSNPCAGKRWMRQAPAQPLARGEAFEEVLSLMWSRQQMSVSLGQLKGYPQPWRLGLWRSCETCPLLSADSAYYVQAELRLSVMVARLEAEQSRLEVPFTVHSLHTDVENQSQPWQHSCMLHALADLLVVQRPGWPLNSRMPVGALAERHHCSGTTNSVSSRCSSVHCHSEASCNARASDTTPRFGLATLSSATCG